MCLSPVSLLTLSQASEATSILQSPPLLIVWFHLPVISQDWVQTALTAGQGHTKEIGRALLSGVPVLLLTWAGLAAAGSWDETADLPRIWEGLGNKPLQPHRFPPGQEESGLWRVFLHFFLHCDSKIAPFQACLGLELMIRNDTHRTLHPCWGCTRSWAWVKCDAIFLFPTTHWSSF